MLHDDGKEQQFEEIWEQINELIEHVNALSLAVEELQQTVDSLKSTEKPKRTYTRKTSSRSKRSEEN